MGPHVKEQNPGAIRHVAESQEMNTPGDAAAIVLRRAIVKTKYRIFAGSLEKKTHAHIIRQPMHISPRNRMHSIVGCCQEKPYHIIY